MCEPKWETAWGDGNTFPEGILQIHVPAKIEASVFISNACTHRKLSLPEFSAQYLMSVFPGRDSFIPYVFLSMMSSSFSCSLLSLRFHTFLLCCFCAIILFKIKFREKCAKYVAWLSNDHSNPDIFLYNVFAYPSVIPLIKSVAISILRYKSSDSSVIPSDSFALK